MQTYLQMQLQISTAGHRLFGSYADAARKKIGINYKYCYLLNAILSGISH